MNTLILVFAALFGACVGSFLNVCIFRMPRACLRLWKPKLSFCPKCRRTLEWWENIPILGYIALGGKCRTCKASIPLRYFFVELGTACLFLYLAGREVAVDEAHRSVPLFLVHAILGSAFIVAAIVDWDYRIIPDEIDVVGLLVAPFVAFFVPTIFFEVKDGAVVFDHLLHIPDLAANASILLDSALPAWGLSEGTTSSVIAPLRAIHDALVHSPWQLAISAAFTSLVGAAAGGGLVWIIGWAGKKVFGAEAMGFGDVKLMAMIGGFAGWQGVLGALILACLVGSVYGIYHKVKTGRTTITGKDIVVSPTPVPEGPPMRQNILSYFGLRIFGAPAPPSGYKALRAFILSKEVYPLRPGGGLAARFATGDSYLPFGPFLVLGAFVCTLWPNAIYGALLQYSAWMNR
ncbi:MAG: A24 family peptidase [Planctomycetota bacterium]